MKKVLLISPTAVPGGAERCLVNLAKQLPYFGWDPLVLVFGDGILDDWLSEGGCAFRILKPGRVRNIGHFLSTVMKMSTIAKKGKFSVVISNQTKGHLYGSVAARLAGIPSIMWQHGIPSNSLIDRVTEKFGASAIVVGSRDSCAAQKHATPNRRVDLIHPGVEIGNVEGRIGSGSEIRSKMGLSRVPTVGIVGRLQPWKGQRLFMRAAEIVARHRADVHFLVVGGAVLGWEGNYPEELQTYVKRSSALRGRVEFVGHQEDVYPWFDALDVVVHASEREPFGLVLVEAMAMGRPLVAMANGGPMDVVEDGRSGLLIKPNDAKALAGGILRVLDDQDLARLLASEAKARAKSFGSEAMAKKWSVLLEEVTGSPTSG